MLGWNYSRKVILTRSKEQAQPLPIDANDDARAPARLPTVAAAPVLAESARRREAMSFLSMEDLQGTWEAVLFPRVYERHQLLCRELRSLSVGRQGRVRGGRGHAHRQ